MVGARHLNAPKRAKTRPNMRLKNGYLLYSARTASARLVPDTPPRGPRAHGAVYCEDCEFAIGETWHSLHGGGWLWVTRESDEIKRAPTRDDALRAMRRYIQRTGEPCLCEGE